jgi:hypothetical protein
MRWAGRLARYQARPRVIFISSCNIPFIMLQTAARAIPRTARTISTLEDEPKENAVKVKETVSEVANAPELLQNGFVVSQIITR